MYILQRQRTDPWVFCVAEMGGETVLEFKRRLQETALCVGVRDISRTAMKNKTIGPGAQDHFQRKLPESRCDTSMSREVSLSAGEMSRATLNIYI